MLALFLFPPAICVLEVIFSVHHMKSINIGSESYLRYEVLYKHLG